MASHQEDTSCCIGVYIDTETIIQQLQDVLVRYSSQDIIREIVQNADDAGAGNLVFFVLETGIPSDPKVHPLLQNSALLVLNDGPLKKEDITGITRLIGGSKQDDSSKVGRFGLGLKSLFHVCEAFFFGPYRSPDSSIQGKLFDPWIGIRKTSEYCDKLPQWQDSQTIAACEIITEFIDKNYGNSYKNGFFIYIPFRDVRQRNNFLTIKENSIRAYDFIKNNLESIQQLVLSFAQCSSLSYIEFFHINSLCELNTKTSIYKFSIKRENFLRRPKKNFAEGIQYFKSIIISERYGKQEAVWDCQGIDSFSPEHGEMQKLQQDIHWPKKGLKKEPEKVLPHAAITILHNKDSNDKQLSLRWASFLPLDDHKIQDNSSNDLVQTIRTQSLQGTWEILLHGYFFLDSDRKDIFGITKTGNEDIPQQWNILLVQQLLLPLFPIILLMKIKEDSKNEKLIDAIQSWTQFQKFSESMTSSCFLVKIATNNIWEIHKEALYMLPEGIPPSLKGWLERQFPHPVAFLNRGLYSPQRHAKLWDGESFSKICEHLPSTPNELAESDISWIKIFIKNIEAALYRQPLQTWLLRMLHNRFFDSKNEKIRSALYSFAEEVFQNGIFYMPMKTEPILRSIAKDKPELLSPCLLLPRTEDKTDSPSSQKLLERVPEKQRIALLRFLGEEKLKDRSKQSEACILLADRLAAGKQIPELDALPLYRISIFFQGKQKEEASRSFQELQQQKSRNCLFKPPLPGSISGILKQLSLALQDVEIWLLRTEATLELGLTTWKDALFEALTANKLSFKRECEEIFKYIIENLFTENKENPRCIQALRNLLAGNHVEKDVRFVLYADQPPAVLEQWSRKYSFIHKDKYLYLSEEHKKALIIVEEQSISSEQLRDILSETAPWQFWQNMTNLCRNPKKDIPDELEELFKTACWIPATQGSGLAPNHILPDDIPAILKTALPPSWMCKETLSADLKQLCSKDEHLWMMKMLDALLEQEQNFRLKQFAELFQDNAFHAPCAFFPPQLDIPDLEHVAHKLRDLAKSITETEEDGKLLSFLLSLPEIPLITLQKFQSTSKFNSKTCRYDIILNAAYTYAKTHEFKPLLPFYAQYLAAARQHDEKLFERDYFFPTRRVNIWKKGSEITEAKIGHEDSAHLDDTVWEACSSFFNAHRSEPNKGPSSVKYLENYFSVPFSMAEKYRVACFLRLIAGENEDIRTLAKKFSHNIDDELETFVNFDDACWNFRISAQPSDSNVEKSLAGSPFEKNKRTFFTYTQPKSGIYYLDFYDGASGKCPAVNQEDFTERLKNSISEWLKQFNLGIKIDDIINKFSPTQYSLSATTALLKEDLRTVIEQLHINNFELKDKQMAIRNSIQCREKFKIEKLKEELWEIAQDKSEIYEALLEKIKNYGYRENGVLLELIQNADDALRERNEPKTRSITIHLHDRILYFSHYGRPINEKYERGSSGNNDLYSMLMLNRSEKESHSATGKLGLGFKSVFLLREQPIIQSKALCFRIRNGMFPQEEKTRLNKHDDEVTLFKLQLKREISDEEMEKRIFSRVASSATLIPVFAREIREVVININDKEKKFAYTPDTSHRGQGWIADYKAQVLCFSDPASGIQLAVRLNSDHIPTRFPDAMPPLWHTLPTVSGLDWDLGYAINGPFSLNAGRSNIALDKKNFDILEAFGGILGESLCDYARFVAENYPDAIAEHNHALWMVLSKGLESPEEHLLGKIVRSLHAGGRGLSYWLTRENVPCGVPEAWSWPLKGVPKKWRTFVFPSAKAMQYFELTVQELHKEQFTSSLANFAYVPSEQRSRLEALGFSVEEMKDAEFFQTFFDSLLPRENRLVPRLFSCLRHLREVLPRQDFPFCVLTKADTWNGLQQVLLPPNIPCELSSDFREEQRKANLAPPVALLAEGYVKDKEDAETYRRLRNAHNVTSAVLHDWITELKSPVQQMKALVYLQKGELKDALIESFRSERQGWIRDIDLVTKRLGSITEIDEKDKQVLLMRLFPDKFSLQKNLATKDEDEEISVPTGNVPQWQEIIDFWQKNKKTITQNYINKTWPSQFRDQRFFKEQLENHDRAAWLVLLLLGYLQSIGRAKPEMHRTFVQELLTKHNYLFTKKVEKDDPQWLFPLSKWQDENISTNSYAIWMACFPALHQLGRFLEQYQNILGNMIRGELDRERLLNCFSPRSAYTFQQAGKQFNAPPFPLRIGKYWVLRELARLNFMDCQSKSGKDFLECCWVPRKCCCDILGIAYIEDSDERQKHLVRALQKQSKTLPHFDYCFDIALCAYVQ